MSRIVQEKFQVNYPQREPQGNKWAKDSSARTKKGTPCGVAAMFDRLPPGMEIERQKAADLPAVPFYGKEQSQVTQDVTTQSLRQGFDRKPMTGTDDQYTREHNDAFYDDIVVDGQHGFLERNNMLDRS